MQIKQMRKSTLILLVVLFGAAAVAVGWSLLPSAPLGRADAANARQVALGTQVYRDHCASCHGANLEGQPNWTTRKPDGRFPAPPHDESGHTWHHPDDVLFGLTKSGLKPPLAPAGYQSDMPAFGGVLTDEQIWAVLAFIKSRWPEKIRARHSSLNERASR